MTSQQERRKEKEGGGSQRMGGEWWNVHKVRHGFHFIGQRVITGDGEWPAIRTFMAINGP